MGDVRVLLPVVLVATDVRIGVDACATVSDREPPTAPHDRRADAALPLTDDWSTATPRRRRRDVAADRVGDRARLSAAIALRRGLMRRDCSRTPCDDARRAAMVAGRLIVR